ncbi:MAG: hypothetical protein QOE45_3075, partial [Frankiaceae bacterium]|nr:hypothetical protein [Frankiaceae bacterium]
NVCSGSPTTIRAFAESAAAATGRSVDLRFGALPYRKDEVWASYGDPARTAEVLGWRAATPLDEGLRLAWEAFG